MALHLLLQRSALSLYRIFLLFLYSSSLLACPQVYPKQRSLEISLHDYLLQVSLLYQILSFLQNVALFRRRRIGESALGIVLLSYRWSQQQDYLFLTCLIVLLLLVLLVLLLLLKPVSYRPLYLFGLIFSFRLRSS